MSDMGTFRTTIAIENLWKLGRVRELPDTLVGRFYVYLSGALGVAPEWLRAIVVHNHFADGAEEIT